MMVTFRWKYEVDWLEDLQDIRWVYILGINSFKNYIFESIPFNTEPLMKYYFQPDLVCMVPWRNASQPEEITAMALNSAYGIIALGLAYFFLLLHVESLHNCISSLQKFFKKSCNKISLFSHFYVFWFPSRITIKIF